MQATNDLSVLQRAYDLVVWLLPRLESLPLQRARHQWSFPHPGVVWA